MHRTVLPCDLIRYRLLYLFLGVLTAGLFAPVASALETTRTLHFVNGSRKAVVLVSYDEVGLTYRQSKKETKVSWQELTAASSFLARKELTPYDDASKRVKLADFARELRLYPEAMEQYEIALALGGLDENSFEDIAAAVEKEEVTWLTSRIDTLLKSRAEPEQCLSAIKRLRVRYPTHKRNAEYQPHIEELVSILAKRKQGEVDAAKAKVDSADLAKLRKKVDKLLARKKKALLKAKELQDAAPTAIARRSISGVKKCLIEPKGAEKYYKRARGNLRDLVRVDKDFQIVDGKQIQKEYDAIAGELIECFLPVARLYMKERNYRGAVKMVQKILFYDPIHEEALEMARIIRKNRIHFKASDRSGIKGPIVTGG